MLFFGREQTLRRRLNAGHGRTRVEMTSSVSAARRCPLVTPSLLPGSASCEAFVQSVEQGPVSQQTLKPAGAEGSPRAVTSADRAPRAAKRSPCEGWHGLRGGGGGDGHDGDAHDSSDDSKGAQRKSARSSASPSDSLALSCASSDPTSLLHDFWQPFRQPNLRAKEFIAASRGDWSIYSESYSEKPLPVFATAAAAAAAAASVFCEDSNPLPLRLDRLQYEVPGHSFSTNRGARLHPELSQSISNDGGLLSSSPLRSAGIQDSRRSHSCRGSQSTCWLGLGVRIDRNGNFAS